MPLGDLQPTLILSGASTDDVGKGIGNAPPAKSRIGLESTGSTRGATTQFGETTRRLLRQRLIIASSVFLTAMLIATVVFSFLGKIPTSTMVSRILAAIVLGSILVFLKKHPVVRLQHLRILEIVIICVPMAEILYVLYARSNAMAEAGLAERVPALRSQIAGVASLVITVYGIFIPNTWKRTAIVSLGIIGVTCSVMAIQHHYSPSLHHNDAHDIEIHAMIVMMLCFFGAVATVGSHVVHGIRRQVEKLREYGQYRLLNEIGRGSMGVVHKAEHRMLKRPAAIKLINADSAADKSAIARFEDEVQISATLSHWNTVQIYDYGQTDNGDFYYVMEYLDGEPLSSRLKRQGALSVEETIRIMTQLCDGLVEAHAIGMIHRDLKPANIFLATVGGEKDVVKILDFGLATLTEENASACGVCGTPSYMSPEQIRGEAVDGRSDIYALGCIFYECLTGKLAYPGETVSKILFNHLEGVMPEHATLTTKAGKLWDVIAKCLEMEKERRFGTVAELKRRLAVANLPPAEAASPQDFACLKSEVEG